MTKPVGDRATARTQEPLQLPPHSAPEPDYAIELPGLLDRTLELGKVFPGVCFSRGLFFQGFDRGNHPETGFL
jgi:hypothetical protein